MGITFRKYSLDNLLLFIAFFSILNNGIFDFWGVRAYLVISAIGSLQLKKFRFVYNNVLTFEFLYFLFLYFIIKFFFDYKDSHHNERTFMQTFDGRYLTQIIRFFLEINSSVYFYSIFKKNKDLFIDKLLYATYFTIFLATIDYFFLGRNLYTIFLGDTHVSYRYTGLNIEPRMFGLILTYIYVFLMFMKVNFIKLIPIILSIFFTVSVSSIFIFLISYLYFNKRNLKVISLFFILLTGFVIFIYLPYIDDFSLIYQRIQSLTVINSLDDYYSVFSVFEVFDRASLNALFFNKEYLIFGFGPNTISIPSSDYLAPNLVKTYNGIINSVPHTGIVNILSRSGILFLIYYIFQFRNKKYWFFFFIYLIQMNFIFYSFYLILFHNNDE